MIKKYCFISIVSILAVVMTSCSDWTEPESKDFFKRPSEDYYKALRAYKKTDHQIAFGWFGNVTGTGASLSNSFEGLPDSMDIVSIWSGVESDEYFEDMYRCQAVKGTRVVKCRFAREVPEKYGWDGTNPSEDNEVMVKAVQEFAKDICEELLDKGYDGLDIDYEPTVGGPEAKGNLSQNKAAMVVWIKALGEYLGPKSGTDKLLLIDGEINHANLRDLGHYFNYLVSQAYGTRNNALLENRLKNVLNNYTKSEEDPLTEEEVTTKLVITENFESVATAAAGGYDFTDDNGNKMKSLEGMARWMPANGYRKAGVGTYHMEAEYPTTPEYKWMRRAIQIMNPSMKTLIK